MLHATFIYNFKISITNEFVSLFREDNFSLRKTGQNIETIKYLKTIMNLIETNEQWASIYSNIKNTSIGHTLFELNCGYHSRVLSEKDVDLDSKSRFHDKLAQKLRKQIEICCQNLLYTQKLQKKTHNQKLKSYSYALNEKICLNSKYIKINRVAI